jgi:hypothetical protein
VTWEPTGTISVTWGRPQVVTGGRDVTFFRDKACQVLQWGSAEPFGDTAMVIRFPQITVFEHPGSGDLDWLEAGQNIELKRVRPDGTLRVLWTGMIMSLEGHADEQATWLDVHCKGSIVALDNGLKQPGFDYRERDIGYVIAEAFNRVIARSHGKCEPVLTGITTRQRGAWTPTASGFVQDLLGLATTLSGDQWTVSQNHRTPVIGLKDTTTVHATLTTGTPGLSIDLSYDLSGAANVIYGEGIDPDGHHWRRTKYPNFFPDGVPAFPLGVGDTFTPGGSDTGFQAFADELRNNGYPAVTSGDTYLAADEEEVRDAQKRAGVTVDGVVGAQTWNAIFQTGDDVGNLNGAYCAPLASLPAVEPYLFNARGAKIGDNPDFDPTVARIERYENFGEGITLKQGITSARAELAKISEPGHMGTLTLRVDPEEISRFELRGGMNVLLKSYLGIDRMLHIADVQVDWQTLSVTLTVDTHARDAMTLAGVWSRNADAATDPVRRSLPQRRRSRQVQDNKIVWDAESGAGIMPQANLQGGLWSVFRVPGGQVGNVVRTVFTTTSPASKFVAAVFGLPVTPVDLIRLVATDPLAVTDPWSSYSDELADAGFLAGWGDMDSAMGYYPKTQDMDGATITGRFDEQASWAFESQRPPWLWIAVYSNTSCKVAGHLYAEPDA